MNKIYIFLIIIYFFSISQSKKIENVAKDCIKGIIFQQENKCTEIEESNKKCYDLFKSAILQSFPTKESDNQFLSLYEDGNCNKNKINKFSNVINEKKQPKQNQLFFLNVSVNCYISGDEPPHYKCPEFENSQASITFNKHQFLLFISPFILGLLLI